MSAFSTVTLTLGGLKYGDEFIEAQKQLAPLKSVTDMGDCADAFVMLAKSGMQSMISPY
jgi:hypothetical protein